MYKKLMIRILIVLFIVAGLSTFLYTQDNWLEKNSYEISFANLPRNFDGYKIIHLSDLHGKEFGKGQIDLVNIIVKAKPNIIILTGDMIDRRDYDDRATIELANKIVKIAPVYFVTGNHEWWSGKYPELKKKLETAGVNILSNETRKISINGQSICLVGIDDPSKSFTEEELYDSKVKDVSFGGVLNSLAKKNKDIFKILLSHRPEKIQLYKEDGYDLVFSGHAHGGQIRIPFVGALFAPDQGLFPVYTTGIYNDGDFNMVVSRGLGNSIIPIRLFNKPEVVEVTLRVD